MESTRIYRWGILGAARISRRGLIPGIRETHRGLLHALASKRPGVARSWALEFGIPRAYGSYRELIDDPEIDVVYVPLANDEHLPWVMAAADAGKSILCEKPLALHTEQAEAMAEHCAQRGVLLMEAFMWRHQPRTLELLRLVRGGKLGDLRLVNASFSFPIDPNDWRLDPTKGGGALWDVGCYGVNCARLFAGCEPHAVHARAVWSKPLHGVDLTLAATLAFPNQVVAQIDCSFEQPYRCRYELVGTKGSLEVPDAFLPRDKSLALLRAVEREIPTELTFDNRNQYGLMAESFHVSLDQNKLIEPAENGVEQMKVLDALLQSARQVGQMVLIS
ncbi:oxidoreductase domain protein [Isosphaera pallida ATCC 43644]|jgi:predicted dehydrogenase|uniref:Oxidoreductase domain protein n=1 Tax=Isosphaera pallida (strain ATCC 43644 / DSM 9630 / IS1B) TaxID=575540 RepID=E8R203_ISOPI|nr:Gfo/Idh/MocA family oxidoreductase [Isosphaera pallida]ADV62435.1 oxidoreductase domain protein [Isosphaera pallida ATCC 43644]